MESHQKRFLKILLLLALPLLNACGQILPSQAQRGLYVDESFLQSSYSLQTESNESCQYNEVLQPDSDTWLDGTGVYSVCGSTSDSTKVTVYGNAPDGAKQYCLFPAQVTANGGIFPRISPSNGLPLMKCSSRGSSDQVFNFEATTFNALFAVPYQDRLTMQACLANGNYYSCPKSFSYGQFREVN